MKNSLIAILLAAPLTMALSGCVIKVNDDGIDHGFVSDSEDRAYKNREKIANVQIGAAFMELYEKLGVADFSETYKEQNKTVRILYYRTQRKHKDGLTTKDECTFLQFVNGQLVETGNGADFSRGN
jgi:hypothetical protein